VFLLLVFINIQQQKVVEAQYSARDIVDVQPLSHTSGLYFQHIKKMHFIKNTWHFIIEMDHGTVFFRLKEMFKQVEDLVKFIEENKNFKNCSGSHIIETELNVSVMNQIVELVNLHNNIDSNLRKSGQFEHPPKRHLHLHRRSKRGLFNPLGNLYKYLFGLMDNDDAHELHKLANNTNALDKQVKLIADNLIKFEQIVEKEFDVKHHEDQLCDYVNTKIHMICTEINNIDRLYDKLNMAVKDAKAKILNPVVMTAEKLLREMSNVTGHLPKGLWWPVDLKMDSMHELIERLINTHVFITRERKLLFIIEVPLVNQLIRYDLLQIVPIPFCGNTSKCAIILPDSKYLGVSEDRRSFVRFDTYMDQCRLANDLIICYVPQVVHDSNQAQVCDIRIFLKNDKNIDFEKDCDIRIGRFENEIFYKITDINEWLYIVRDPVNINFQCSQKQIDSASSTMIDPLILPAGTGIIRATGNYTCTLTTKKNSFETVKWFNDESLSSKVIKTPLDAMFNLSGVLRELDKLQLKSMKINNDLEHNTLHKLTDRLVDLRRLMNNNTIFTGDEIIDESENSWLSNFFSSIGADFHIVKMVFVWIVLSLLALMVFKIYSTCCPGTCSSLLRCRRPEDPTVICVDREMQYMKTLPKKRQNQQHLLALQNKLDNNDYNE
jgi:hypothetical protein